MTSVTPSGHEYERTLPEALAALVAPGHCRAKTSVVRDLDLEESGCDSSLAVVTLACEHEHSFDALLCAQHRAAATECTLTCPHCAHSFAAIHKCRHMLLGATS